MEIKYYVNGSMVSDAAEFASFVAKKNNATESATKKAMENIDSIAKKIETVVDKFGNSKVVMNVCYSFDYIWVNLSVYSDPDGISCKKINIFKYPWYISYGETDKYYVLTEADRALKILNNLLNLFIEKEVK